jgi:hypothetical protein
MNQFGPFVVLIGLAALAMAALGGVVAWWNAEERRIRRGLRKVLGEDPHALIVSPGRGRGAGFNFASGQMAVAWDTGGWCLIYRIEELSGMELIVDGQVAARSWRGEARRPLEILAGAEKQVMLRLIFDDPHHPDFTLELWSADDPGGHVDDALAEGNRWIARTESLFRRSAAPALRPPRVAPRPPAAAEPTEPQPASSPAAAASQPEPPRPSPVATDAGPAMQELPFEVPPWDHDDDEDSAA